MRTVLYWTRSSRTQFGVSKNVWRLAGDTSNITYNFLYCNRQVHRDFLITLYNIIGPPSYTRSVVNRNVFMRRIHVIVLGKHIHTYQSVMWTLNEVGKWNWGLKLSCFSYQEDLLLYDDKARTGDIPEHDTVAMCDSYSPGGKMCRSAFGPLVLALLMEWALAEFHTNKLKHDRQCT
jgi:hypothetical protein